MRELSSEQLDLIRQWFNAVQDLNPAYLEAADYDLAATIYADLGLRIPSSITSNLSNISATNTINTNK